MVIIDPSLQIIRAYRAKHIAPAIWRAAPEHFSVENARNWVQLQPFLDFVAQISQQPVPRTPKHSRPLPDSLSSGFTTAEDALEHLDPDYSNSEHPSKRRHIQQNSSSSPPSSPTPQFRQPPAAEPPAVASVTPASAETVKPVKNHRSGKKITQAEKHIAANRVQISRKQWVDGVFHVTELQESWPVPNDGKMYAYIVDLTGSSLVFKNSNGESLSMANIIKNACTDGWEGGTGGYKSRPTVVNILGDVECQRASHRCRGSFLCSLRNPKLWEGYERWEHDFEPFRELFHHDMENNAAEHDTPLGYAVSVIHLKCQHNSDCNGHAVLRSFAETSSEGKNYFIGCSAWDQSHGTEKTHIFRLIPSRVPEDLVFELFTHGGPLPCRTGLRQKFCLRDHIRDGKVVQGLIEKRPCSAEIVIYSPVNTNIRKAVVIPQPGKPHNHPSYAPEKLTYAAAEAFRAAVQAAGPLGKTVGGIMRAPTTAAILADRSSSEPMKFACLARPRYLQKILMEEKQKLYPHGFDIAGLNHLYETRDLKLPPTHPDRYIHAILSEPSDDGNGQITVIITMVPGLAQFTHDAHTTLHDNTYKRVHGDFNEWEVVIWDSKGNRRMTVARIYCNRETRQAFCMIWCGWLNSLEKATGKRLKFKAIHGEGKLGTMLMDGSAPQIQGLGDMLLKENNPSVSGILTTDCNEIVQWVVRTCDWHFKHNLDALSELLTKEEMDRIRLFRFLTTQEEMNEFTAWASSHPEKKLRDWFSNKEVHLWYIPSLCRHFSKIKPLDWDLSPADNNLNETSHPATNRATGIRLSLVEAIEMAKPYDLQVWRDWMALDITCRMVSRALKYDEDHGIRTKLNDINRQLAELDEEQRVIAAKKKASREEKKQTSGGKKRKTKVATGRRPTLPAPRDIVEKENEPPMVCSSLIVTPLQLDSELEPPMQMTHFPFTASFTTPLTTPSLSSMPQLLIPPSTCPASFYGGGAMSHSYGNGPFIDHGWDGADPFYN
ncbi:hypothetical protein M422DRAFT_783248 [Sphaerobolus stellatus SS14]|uniref:Uncharacterized protein n=1 Tax=Sphaerobolus stellatus (strain SS14) TaxID=990650 RepID=A0A0C9TS79_SPHS4|nr:hypothetical protein M422DRAFT_783248 [Sphaerobolus stellatus SS14]